MVLPAQAEIEADDERQRWMTEALTAEGSRVDDKHVTVGFIGLGDMGGAMATTMSRAGVPLLGFDQRAEAREPHTAGGGATARLAGEPARAYAVTRGLSEHDLDQAEERLTKLGCLSDGLATLAGADVREEIEQITDRMCAPIEESLGDDLPELVRRLQPWGDEIRIHHGYYPTAPQEEVIHPAVQEWMEEQGLHRLAVVPADV